MGEQTINLEGIEPVDFYGVNNAKFNLLKKAFPRLRIVSRGDKIKVDGSEEDIERFAHVVSVVTAKIQQQGSISMQKLEDLLFSDEGLEEQFSEQNSKILVYGINGRIIKAKTENQQKLVDSSHDNDVVFAIGPAGTGKTYTAVALAVKALKEKRVRRIILTRPAVEAGESLGFLPGDLKEKIDPYLRPLYDALDDMFPAEKLRYLMETRVIEIAPLAFMRGRTLDNAFIILDEAQNATTPQLKMFLTRIGPRAKCIITGDLTQIDLPKNQKSGLSVATRILSGIKGIGVIWLDASDVIRHRLVKAIINAYEKDKPKDKEEKSEE